MLLADALQGLATELDVLCATTQGRLLARVARQLTRLSHCEESLRFAVLRNGQALTDRRRENESLTRELDEAHAQQRKLQMRVQGDKIEREEEKEWIAALWPDGVVLPTILQSYAPGHSETRFVNQIEAKVERQRLEAMVRRRAAKERVQQQMEIATQWKMVIVPPTEPAEGEYVPGQTYYQNTVTGESAWEAPVAMFFEPPIHWDRNKMDWKDSYSLEHFYVLENDASNSQDAHVASTSQDPIPQELSQNEEAKSEEIDADGGGGGDSSDGDDDDKDSFDGDQTNVIKGPITSGEEGDDDDDKPDDPVVLRAQLEQAFERSKEIQGQLNKNLAEQRALSLQLLNATRDSFEREKAALEVEDNVVKDAERQKRKALKEEEEAAKAAAQVKDRKALDKAVQPKFARDSVARKDLTLSKDDELLEKELEAFAIEQRKDRLYLASPLARDDRVKYHHQLDDEYVHVKFMDQLLLEVERTEFDLLEKTAQRLEEATKRSEELAELLDKTRTSQLETDEELERLPQLIVGLEEPHQPPPEPRPLGDILERAKERFVVADGDDSPEDDDVMENSKMSAGDANDSAGAYGGGEEDDDEQEEEVNISSGEDVDGDIDGDVDGNDNYDNNVERGQSPRSKEVVDPEAVARDEAELRALKAAVNLEKAWKDWELSEVVRLEDLAAAYDRFQALEAMKRRLVVDVALFQSELQFFHQLQIREKELNEKLWAIQANSQVERARFLMERAVREESIFQVTDEYEAVVQLLDEAKRLPRQARNPLEKLELIEESKRKAADLQSQLSRLQERFTKEQEAKRLLVDLETRFCDYSQTKLREEATLFAEKQSLWDTSTALHMELTSTRDMIEKLYLSLQGEPDAATSDSDTRAKYEGAVALFEEKLQRVEAVRQFVLLCYERESRWRSLAAVALVKDTSSDEWMTQMQRERQDQMLATLEKQHERQQLELQKEIKLLHKVKSLLQTQISERDAKIERLRSEYQAASDDVRLETEQIISGLKSHLLEEKEARKNERERAKADRERLMEDHNKLTAELQDRIAELENELEQQWHWLTAAKRELHAQRVANEELLVGYQSLEKRRATETNDMRFRISSQITKINNIEMWNLSLKIQAREAHAERVKMQRDIEKLVLHHKQQQRLLRLENWKHRVTAQAILTDVDALFLFLAQGIEILAGATVATNTALRKNGGIELLALLAQHSCQDAIRVIASKALGQIAWNSNVTPRSLGWKAKKLWFQWETRQSTRVLQELATKNLEFDSVASEQSSEMNWLADTSASGGVGESDSDLFDKQKKIRFLQIWNARDDVERSDANSANQEYIGLAPTVLKTIIDLCRQPSAGSGESEVCTKIQRNALRSLAIVVMNTRNTAIVGRMDGCISLLVGLLRPGLATVDAGVTRHAIHALANLAFENTFNKGEICRAGAVPWLLENLQRHGDVDVLHASAQALAYLSFEHLEACEAIFDAGGMSTLTRLCHSFRIHDAIDLDVYETIQTCAAETVSNVIAMLDGNSSPQAPNVERNVALAILSASEEPADDEPSRVASGRTRPGVATFVLMCASCTRDVAFHGALVLGSIAQHDAVRAAIGDCGGVDALFLLTRARDDAALVAQASWALANATWNRENQYRVARYLDALEELATFPAEPSSNQDDCSEQIREHALCVVANALFYNDANRQLVAAHASWMALLEHTCRTGTGPALEHAARALCSLSYCDAVALALGGVPGSDALSPARAVNGLDVLVRLCARPENALVQRNGLYGLINMCLHDANKSRLLEIPHAIETLVNLSGSTNRELCDPALEALDLLADVRASKQELVGSGVLSSSTLSSLAASDLKKLIALLHDATGSPALVAMASDAIADEVWRKPSAKIRLRNEHGLDKLLELCVDAQSPIADHERVLLSCLWALRNSIADNVRNQDYVGALGGVPRLVGLYDRWRHHSDVVEAVLAVLVALVMTNARNSQELVQTGLDVLLGLAESDSASDAEEEEERREQGSLASRSPSKKLAAPKREKATRENRALAKELLLLLAPYNAAPQHALPSLAPSPDKLRGKKPRHVAASSPTQLPPLVSGGSPTKRANN